VNMKMAQISVPSGHVIAMTYNYGPS